MNTAIDSTNQTAARPAPAEAPWRVVMMREIMVKVTDKAFIVGTLVTLLLVIGSMAASAYFTSRPSTTDLAVVSPAGQRLGQQMDAVTNAANDKAHVNVKQVADVAAGEQLLRDGDADAVLVERDGSWQLVFKASPDDKLVALTQQTLATQVMAQTAAKAGTSMDEITRQTQVSTQQLQGDADRARAGQFIGLIFAVLFLMSAMTYGMQIAQSVIEEKQSRIVEILVSAIPVRQLLAGKVLGNTVLALAQMALLVATGLIGASFVPRMKSFVPAMSQAVGWYLLLFLAGFLALACIWAAAGAMGTRNEDLQQTSQPLIYILMFAYMAGFLATGTWKVVLSYLPIVSSILMPARIVEGTAGWLDGLAALAVNLAFAAVTVLVGERIYRRALLRTQGRLSYREAFKLKG